MSQPTIMIAKSTIEALWAEVERARAERDALLPVVEAAKAWRRSGAYFGSGNADPERLLAAAVDALEPTKGAQPP